MRILHKSLFVLVFLFSTVAQADPQSYIIAGNPDRFRQTTNSKFDSWSFDDGYDGVGIFFKDNESLRNQEDIQAETLMRAPDYKMIPANGMVIIVLALTTPENVNGDHWSAKAVDDKGKTIGELKATYRRGYFRGKNHWGNLLPMVIDEPWNRGFKVFVFEEQEPKRYEFTVEKQAPSD